MLVVIFASSFLTKLLNPLRKEIKYYQIINISKHTNQIVLMFIIVSRQEHYHKQVDQLEEIVVPELRSFM